MCCFYSSINPIKIISASKIPHKRSGKPTVVLCTITGSSEQDGEKFEPDRIHKTATMKQHVDIIYSSSCDRLGDLFCPKLPIFSEKYELENIYETNVMGINSLFLCIHTCQSECVHKEEGEAKKWICFCGCPWLKS